MDSIESKVARIDERTQMMMDAIKQLDAKVSAPCPHHNALAVDVGGLQKAVQEAFSESRLGDAEIRAIVLEAIAESRLSDADLKKDIAILTVKVAGVIGLITMAGSVFFTHFV